ncbi:aldo/keto reductase [Mycobacterium sp. NBC_00419]|uniref:aldo/keto reductase n=1 Tax=Mycobacterium sp. NBC_00419 TaxID=2975989 RepID=UPI002E1CFD88
MTTDIPGRQCGTTCLPGSGLTISRIGLGFAHAHLLDPATRVALINRALDLGITHFDTARFYSDGLSEKALGQTLAGRRSSVTITTKFGLLPTPLIASLGPAAMPARKVRSLLNKLRLVPYPRRSYTPEVMRKALHASLRALNTDYIDIYHLHEPLEDSQISDDVIAELQKAKASGSIRAIGVSGLAGNVDGIVERYRDAIDVIQTDESSWGSRPWVPDITHSLFADAVRAAPGGTLPSESVRRILTEALGRRPQGAVIVQTSSTARLAQLVEFANG